MTRIYKTWRTDGNIFIIEELTARLTCIVDSLQIGYYVDSDDKIFHVKFFVPDKHKMQKIKILYMQ